jgi:hypothetical protein
MKRLSVALVVVVASSVALAALESDKADKHPSLSVKASPAIAFSPARVVVTADLKGGANDAEEYYCPTIEWEWGDGTVSDQSLDCDPYEPGKTEIKRRFIADRIFHSSGDFRISLKLKRRDKVIAAASTYVKIRPGVRDFGGQ